MGSKNCFRYCLRIELLPSALCSLVGLQSPGGAALAEGDAQLSV